MKTGVLVTNLGTPKAPTSKALRVFLREFLSDPRVIPLPRWLWQPVLRALVLPIRSPRSLKLYRKIWMPEGSPLRVFSQRLVQKLQKMLGSDIVVALGMRYGEPSIAQALNQFKVSGIKKIIVLPLYPQYAASTVGSTFDMITQHLQHWRWVPTLHFINGYYDYPCYIDAVCESIKAHTAYLGNNKLLFSFHGLPKCSIDLGDPYYDQCQMTARIVARKLRLSQQQWQVVFQSRFGRKEWLQPYCDRTLAQLPKQGVKNVVVVCPGFAVDCLETLEEIAIRNKEIFLSAGGERYQYIPALNDSDLQVTFLRSLLPVH